MAKKLTEHEQNKNAIAQMRAGMMNFLGQYISLLPFNGEEKNKVVVAMLAEEALKSSQLEENTPCSLYVLEPLLKSIIVALEHNCKAILNQHNHVDDEIDEIATIYTEAIIKLEHIIKLQKKEKE